MYPARHQPRSRITLCTIFMTVLVISYLTYKFCLKVRDDYINREKRCLSELANVKYQLDNVLDYKKKMDTVISEMQQEGTILRQSVKEFSNSYLLMKQHLEICEMQTEDLEVECKAIKTKLQNTEAELSSCKKAPG